LRIAETQEFARRRGPFSAAVFEAAGIFSRIRFGKRCFDCFKASLTSGSMCVMGRIAHSSAARKLRRELDQELAANSAAAGTELYWTAAELAILERIACTIDHIQDLSSDYARAETPKLRVQIAAEIRLQDGLLARLLKLVRTDVTNTVESPATRRARRAAQARWSQHAG
jgi:hypothetical protein